MDKETYFRIEELKRLLEKEDFKTIKYVQGKLTEEEFAKVTAQCEAWREEINQLEQKLKSFKEE